jgi:hypothetical protein
VRPLGRVAVGVPVALGGLALLLGLLSLDDPYTVGGPIVAIGLILAGVPLAIARRRRGHG